MESVLKELLIENKALADLTHVHSKSDMLQEVQSKTNITASFQM
jgi:hypothetical protein